MNQEEFKMTRRNQLVAMLGCLLLLSTLTPVHSQDKPLILQEMGWVDVQEYLKTNDMVIIPLGSTEQHGRHLPLGTDCYEAGGIAEKISTETGVLVAPVLWVGYSVYHSGFPGTLSLKPETMEQVLFECAELLISYGFRRIMFFNYHGGNNVVQQSVIHRINHNTEAIALAIGHGSSVQRLEPGDFMDWHAGKGETSLMLVLRPDLVRMDRAEKPVMTFTPKQDELLKLSKKHPELASLPGLIMGVPKETGKGGASHELSSNGVWSFNHPNEGSVELGKKRVKAMTDNAVNFIEAWKKAKH